VTLSLVRGLICVGMLGVVSVVRHEGRRCLKVRQLEWPRRVIRILISLAGGHCGRALRAVESSVHNGIMVDSGEWIGYAEWRHG
jgi:hypothetical protein